MHTSAFKSCRIHHDGDYENEIIITNMDSTSEAIGTPSDIRFTVRKLINFQRNLERSNFKENCEWITGKRARPNNYTVTIKGLKGSDCGKEITILQKDIEDFLALRLMSKIEEKLEGAPYSSVVKIAQELRIKE